MNNKSVKFNEEADKFLDDLYLSVGATTATHKYNLLKIKLGGEYNFYSGENLVNDEIKQGCLEYEILSKMGLIELSLA